MSSLRRGLPRPRLRPLHAEDLPVLARWWNDGRNLANQTNLVLPQPAVNLQRLFVAWSLNQPGSRDAGLSIELPGGGLIGHATLCGGDTPARAAEFAIILGPLHRGQGLGTAATELMLRHGFGNLGLHRIHLGVYEYNTRARRAYAKAGFRVEGVQRQAVFHDGRFHDRILMSILAPEFIGAAGSDVA